MKKLTLALVAASVAATMTTGVMAQTVDHGALKARESAATEADTTRADNELNFGTLTVNGEVIDQTCQVSTGYKHLIVQLEKVGVAELNGQVGKTAKWSPFYIKLENCKATEDYKVLALFQPTADHYESTTGTLLNKSADQAATGVSIQLTLEDKSTIIVAGNVNPKDTGHSNDQNVNIDLPTKSAKFQINTQSYGDGTAITGEDVTLQYGAQYYALDATVAPGKVQAYTPYVITYK